MQFFIQTIVALALSSLAATSPTPVVAKGVAGPAIVAQPISSVDGENMVQTIWNYSFLCETSNNSPTVDHAQSAATYLVNLGSSRKCVQNTAGNGCATMVVWGSGKFQICGTTGNYGSCQQFGYQLREFAQTWQCASNGKVGGRIFVNGDGSNANLYLRWIAS